MYWHRSNADILKVIYTECHTVDYAHFKLKFLLAERQDYISYTLAQNKRTLAEVIQADLIAKDEQDTRQHRVLAEYHLAEAKALHPSNQKRIDYARQESEFIESLIAKLEPHRIYGDMPELEAEQKAAFDNMAASLVWNSYLDLCSINVVSSERYVEARSLGDSSNALLAISSLRNLYANTSPEEFLTLDKKEVLSLIPHLIAHTCPVEVLPKPQQLLVGHYE